MRFSRAFPVDFFLGIVDPSRDDTPMRRPRIKDCHGAAVELRTLAAAVRGTTLSTQAAIERAERCERMAAWLGELADEMADQIKAHDEKGWPKPFRAPVKGV